MEFKRILLSRTLFNATTQDLNIPADNVKYLDISLNCKASGATACDVAHLAATPLDEIRVQLGGEWICNIHFSDALALQAIWENILAHALTAAGGAHGADTFCKIEGLRLPLHVTKMGKSLSTVFTWLTPGTMNSDNDCVLDVSYQYREKPFASHFNYQYKEHTATTAATDYEITLDNAGCELIGLMIYSEIIQTATAHNTTVSTVKVLVDDREVWHENWETMTKLHQGVDTVSDPTDWGPQFDNYRWLDFQQEPLPAGKLRLLYQTRIDTAHMARFIPVYIQKNQAQ